MLILICCATHTELKVIKNQIKKADLKTSLSIDYLCTGIGNHETIFALTRKLSTLQSSEILILNIGLCGYQSDETPPPIVQIATLEHIDIRREQIVPIFHKFATFGHLVSSEKPVYSFDRDTQPRYFDMEGYGVVLVAQKLCLPCLLLKIPFDKIGKETVIFDRELALQKLANSFDSVYILSNLLNLDKKTR
ncbi:hypothetical protein AGMMS50249_3450 [candidate division SR1 bacterium]|nr:hypothetical protein AGMMS50249_3450 [candidate division SR1 bacterium]